MLTRTAKKSRLYCWEVLDPSDPLLPAVRGLYESALEPEERIPWAWLERAVSSRADWRPGGQAWSKHLIVASTEAETTHPDRLAGFCFAVYLPGYGGYVSYVATAERFRRRGVGSRLFEQAFNLLAVDAAAADEALPFVIWESREPETARRKLFGRVGGREIDGVTLMSPDWNDDAAPEVPLTLFLKPCDETEFDEERTRAAVDGLLRRVYRMAPGDAGYDRTLTPGCRPRLERVTP